MLQLLRKLNFKQICIVYIPGLRAVKVAVLVLEHVNYYTCQEI